MTTQLNLTRLLSVVALAIVALLAFTRPAPAATTIASFPCGNNYASGSYDSAGNVYVPCGDHSKIKVMGPDGTLKREIQLGFLTNDVAPSPDGAYLYATRGKAAPVRLNRQTDGSYIQDSTWKPASFQMWGATYQPSGQKITTDAAGNIYLADGSWANDHSIVLKYGPAGNLITQFGEWGNTWQLGVFYGLHGIAVKGDGSSVFTVEGNNNRIQRWDRQADGRYVAKASLGSTAETNPEPGSGSTVSTRLAGRAGWHRPTMPASMRRATSTSSTRRATRSSSSPPIGSTSRPRNWGPTQTRSARTASPWPRTATSTWDR